MPRRRGGRRSAGTRRRSGGTRARSRSRDEYYDDYDDEPRGRYGRGEMSNETSGMAIAGLVLALTFWPAGLIVSWLALNDTKYKKGRGMAVAGLVISGFCVFIMLIWIIIIAAAVSSAGSSMKHKAKRTSGSSSVSSCAVCDGDGNIEVDRRIDLLAKAEAKRAVNKEKRKNKGRMPEGMDEDKVFKEAYDKEVASRRAAPDMVPELVCPECGK